MHTIKGTVSKIKVLKLSESPLVRFSLDGANCLITKHSLHFLYQVQEETDLVACGTYNSRNQFVVSKFCPIVSVNADCKIADCKIKRDK